MTQETLEGKCAHTGKRKFCPSLSMSQCSICQDCGKHITGAYMGDL